MATRSAAPLAAYVLHRYDWSESSLILELFTREQGRLAVAAKGAKRPHSQLRSALLPLQRLTVTLNRGAAAENEPREVQTLRAAEFAGGTPMPGGAALFSGFYLNELLLRLLARGDPHPALFDAYALTLPLLASGDDALVQSALRAFELVLLRETGVLPELSLVTATQEPLVAGRRYALVPEKGIVAAGADDAVLAAESWLRLEGALAHGRIDALRAACASCLAGLKPMLRASLLYHLGASPLRTRQVMLDLQDLR